MEFRMPVEELRRALHRAQGVVERKAAMPILACVLLTARKGSVSVTAFDLDIAVVSELPAEVEKAGALAVSAKHLFDIVQSLPLTEVSVRRLSNNYAELTCGAAHFKIVGMSADDFPQIPTRESAALVSVSGLMLSEMIRKTSFAISVDETRYILNGVFFEPKERDTVRMVATDGHRLSLVERSLPGDFKLRSGVILPRKGLLELKRLLDEAPDAACELGFAESSAIFRKPNLTMVMRLIDGQFPEYQRVIPKDGERQVQVSRVGFLEALKRIVLLSSDKSNAIKLHLAEGALRITASNPELGEAKDELQVEYRGSAVTIGFNARYLIDVLAVLDSDAVQLSLGDEHSPGVLRPAHDTGYLAVVMPMRV